MYIVVGLGNPGKEYANTRHNTGFMFIDKLADKHNISVTKEKFKALIGDGIIEGKKVLLVKPQTFMNLSGDSLIEIVNFYKEDIENIIVAYDDIDLEVPLPLHPSPSSSVSCSLVFPLLVPSNKEAKISPITLTT